ncbi:MAG: GNAT family N-acetyltransferase [Acidobacteria bacterium]|nr:GNAT family N-acetyltransferase [Acidobacteriota bacterium]MCI0724020.1 GNAT family N-acetyltransferase [Acidobacteriota bacterium]
MVQIREAKIEDVNRLAEIHSLALPGDLLPRMGRRFLTGTFYPIVLNSQHAFTLVCTENGSIESFVIFAYHSGELASELKAPKFRILSCLARSFWRYPGVALQVLTFLGGRVSLDEQIGPLEEMAELYSIATHPSAQSRGVGSLLVREGLNRLRAATRGTCLVKTSSDRARQFYLRLGFRDIGKEIRGRRKLFILIYPLT